MISTMRRWAVLMMVVGGCSLTMRGPDPRWDGKQEPECSDSYAPVFLDGLVATSVASAVAEVATTSEVPLDGRIVAVGVGISLLFTVTAFVGASRYRECRSVMAEWHISQAMQDSRTKAAAQRPATVQSPSRLPRPTTVSAPAQGAPAQRAPAQGAPAQGVPVQGAPVQGAPVQGAPVQGAPAVQSPPTSATPHSAPAATRKGYFCVNSAERPRLNICVRERSACEHARKVLAIPDDTSCVPRDVAWCFDKQGEPRCFSTQSGCNSLSAALMSEDTPCTERP